MEKARIDIEELLIWAYRDMCIDRTTDLAPEREWEPMSYAAGFGTLKMLAELGIIVHSTGTNTEGLSKPWEDAERLHAAVLALGDMFIVTSGAQVTVWDKADEEVLGFKIHQTARGYEWRPSIGEAFPAERACTVALLVRHAKASTKPDCYLDWQPGQPMRRDAKGRLVPDHDAVEITAREVSVARASYHVWRAALVALAATLHDKLDLFAITGPRAEEAPWLTKKDAPRVFDVGPISEAEHDKLLKRRRKTPV
ncbi:hypothetical protein [Microvirga solisilvae]|uniref:hypothetical protein n=1 Tax=Microvirga solisilvae TaxID=2919498 RepID=UPI001FAFD0B9|nr:hypothetical protein [Microvirga solisilvae]